MDLRILATAAILLLCAGCGTFVNPKGSYEAYRNARPCCASLAEIPMEKLEFPTKIEFMIDEKSPLFDFELYGKSFFKAFELPVVGSPYRADVRSYVLMIFTKEE